jgi:hypothetical protein
MLVHDERGNDECRRILVLPTGEPIPNDIERALQRAKILLLRFALKGRRVSILE